MSDWRLIQAAFGVVAVVSFCAGWVAGVLVLWASLP